MRKILSILCASSLSLAMDVSSLIPASAAPFMTGRVELGSGLEQIQYYRDGYGPRRYYRPYAGRWNGYRGYRYRHDGYRRHNDGWWYPLAAFGAGALIGGAIANQGPRRVYRSIGSAHVQWCYDRYRSYRAYDNTYQPYDGLRRQCYSPYN